MLLTPIHVRGRRKIRDEDDDAPKPIPSGPRGGRPLLSAQAKLSSSQTRSHKRARLLTTTPLDKPRKKRKPSLLESIPNELIEKIFLHSLNVNLARSSPILAAAVSTERIYRALILLAFWDNSTELSASPYSRESRDAISRSLRPLDYTPISLAQRKDLQTAILHCRWCTVPRILDQLPELMNLVIQQHWFGAGISMAEEQEKLLYRVLALEDDANVFEGFETINTTPDTSTPVPTNNYTLTINPSISITITNHSIEQETTHPFLSPLIIPNKYLQGSTASDSAPATPSSSLSDDGFTPALVTYLEIHRRSLGFNSVTLPLRPPKHPLILSRPCLQQGIHTAIVSNNLSALLTLLKLDEFYFRVTEQQHLTAQDQDQDQEPVIPYALSAGHFRTAVRLAPRNPEFFQALVRANAESVPADDPEITDWAMRLQDPFGRWLLELMLRLPEQTAAAKRNPVQNSVFWMGRANADRRELASMYLRDVLGGVEGLESWMGEMHVPLSLPSS